MSRESAETKGARYLTEGRMVVLSAGPSHFLATVRGSGEIHTVRFGRGGWSCTCPARSLCSHLVAARLVAAPDAGQLIAPERHP